MRNISQLAISMVLLATQVQDPFTDLPGLAKASADTQDVYEVKIDTASANHIVVTGPKGPDYDAEVLAPLREAQAKAAEAAKAKAAAAKKRATVVTRKVTASVKAAATPENMLALRLCEAGNVYTRNSGNGYYGAYQFDIGTWGNWGGYARPDLAPASVQDEKFMETYARRGWSPWRSCAIKLGLM